MQILLFVGLKCKTFRYDVLLMAECIGVNGDKLPAARVKRPDLDTFVTGSCSDASCISASCICGQSQDLPALCNSDRVDCLKTLLNTKISKMHPLAFVSPQLDGAARIPKIRVHFRNKAYQTLRFDV